MAAFDFSGLVGRGIGWGRLRAKLAEIVGKFTYNVADGTILTKVKVEPGASATTAGANYHKLVSLGDVTGNTAYGMGDPAKPTTGVMGSFGRTALATGTFTDTAADFRVINKLVDTTGVHGLQAAYLKAKNYTGATLTGDLIGAFVEVVNDGTVSGKTYGIKIGKDTGAIDADIVLTSGAQIVALTTAITANSTTTSAPAGSIGITTNATGVGKLFVSDGSKWQYAAIS